MSSRGRDRAATPRRTLQSPAPSPPLRAGAARVGAGRRRQPCVLVRSDRGGAGVAAAGRSGARRHKKVTGARAGGGLQVGRAKAAAWAGRGLPELRCEDGATSLVWRGVSCGRICTACCSDVETESRSGTDGGGVEIHVVESCDSWRCGAPSRAMSSGAVYLAVEVSILFTMCVSRCRHASDVRRRGPPPARPRP